jgi:hypothetical protein
VYTPLSDARFPFSRGCLGTPLDDDDGDDG